MKNPLQLLAIACVLSGCALGGLGHHAFYGDLHSVRMTATPENVNELYVGHTPLWWAAKHGNKDVALHLIFIGADVNLGGHGNADYSTPLTQALKEGHKDIAIALIRAGATVDSDQALAIAEDDPELFRTLVARGMDIHAKGSEGRTVLHIAAQSGDPELIDRLIEEGAKLDAADRAGITALHIAARNGQVETLRKLIQGGATLEVTDRDGHTPLRYAVNAQEIEAVKALLAAGADPNHAAPDGLPINSAARKANVELIKLLVARGSKLESKDFQDRTPLLTAINNKDLATAKTLLEAGAEVRGASKYTMPLTQAVYSGSAEMVQLLLSRGAKLDAVDSNGDNILHYLSDLSFQPETIDPVIHAVERSSRQRLGKFVNQANNQGLTPLQRAAQKDRVDVVRLLASIESIRLDAPSQQGTALYIAAQKGNWDAYKRLLQEGANPATPGPDGRTAAEVYASHLQEQERKQAQAEAEAAAKRLADLKRAEEQRLQAIAAKQAKERQDRERSAAFMQGLSMALQVGTELATASAEQSRRELDMTLARVEAQAAAQRIAEAQQRAAEAQARAEAQAYAAQQRAAAQQSADARAAANAAALQRQTQRQAQTAYELSSPEAKAKANAAAQQAWFDEQSRQAALAAQRQVAAYAAANAPSRTPTSNHAASSNSTGDNGAATQQYLDRMRAGIKLYAANCVGTPSVGGTKPNITPKAVSCIDVHYRTRCGAAAPVDMTGTLNTYVGGGCFGDAQPMPQKPSCPIEDVVVEVTEVAPCR